MAGPWLCILGGIYAERVIVQLLTEYIWLAEVTDNRLIFRSRLFGALKLAIASLGDYYRFISSTPNEGFPFERFPFIREYRLPDQSTQSFTYKEKVGKKLVYKATLDQSHRAVIVKFVSRYNAEAHRLLASHNVAPGIHYAVTKDSTAQMFGEHYVVVVDFWDGSTPSIPLSNELVGQVSKAITLLHSNKLVFGDLRAPNIVVKGQQAVLVDFDWCDKAGEGLYPPGMNQEIICRAGENNVGGA